MPKTYFQITGADLRRDYALLYEGILRGEGVAIRVDLPPGLPHALWSFFPGAKFSVDWREKTKAGLKWLVEG